MSDMSLQLGVQFQLLKTKLVAVYEKKGTVSSFLLTPTNPDEIGSVTLGEMMEDLTKAFGTGVDKEKIKNDLQALDSSNDTNSGKGADSGNDTDSKFDVNKLNFSLKTAYIYVNGNVKEYAFSIEVDCGDAIPDLGFVKMEKLVLKIWNTQKNVVLQQLNLDTIENLVKKLDAPEKKIAEA
ncbi:hypothetical protein OQX63_15620 [Pedobacter sp. PF22-3]|uniref:hypothetical protein n=1 Tax=Pedobacter sp. PF22-3 TaxID=2994467 RepID=UPI00224587D1|nr:hypothetical protein [Pedobacter sp. PF22-3]MCX2494918.1 hypothetical protein [Pedobacter sp. PF22-3]